MLTCIESPNVFGRAKLVFRMGIASCRAVTKLTFWGSQTKYVTTPALKDDR